jgi:membrane-associated PAP2 superfamily phosphatase
MDHMTASAAPTSAPRLFAPLVGVTTAGVLLQAITAGLFMALRRQGGEGWIVAHDVIADVTVLVAIVAAVIALVAVRRSRPRVAWSAVALAVLLILQTLVGHLMADAKLGGLVAVHVPLALIIFGGTIWLSIQSRTRREA